jgi:hypothetical protein
MPMTNFPTGFAAGLSLRGMPLLQTQTGNVFWLGNGPVVSGGPGKNTTRTVAGSDGNPGTFQRPFATLNFALSQCQHGSGDIIFVKPLHQENINGAGTTTAVKDPTGQTTVSAGTTLAFGTAGVAIIGLGAGSLRPTFNLITATTANISVNSANMSIQNCLFNTNFAAVASAFTNTSASALTCTIANNVLTTGVTTGTITLGMNVYSATGGKVAPGTIILSQLSGTTGGAGTYAVSVPQTVTSGTFLFGTWDFNIENCEFRDQSSALNLLTVFTGAATNANSHDGFRFVGNRISSLGTTAATTALVTTVAGDRWRVTDNFGCWAVLNDTACMLASGALNMTNIDFARNVLEKPNTSSTGGSFVSTSGTAWTGHAYDNYMYQVDNTAGIWIATGTGGAFGFSNNFSPITGAVDKSALINPAAV